MRIVAVLLQLLVIVGAAWTPATNRCDQALLDPGHVVNSSCCCSGNPEDSGPHAPSPLGSCCASDLRCDQPCAPAIVFLFQRERAPQLDRVLLGTASDCGHPLHGIRIPPEPRPPPRHVA